MKQIIVNVSGLTIEEKQRVNEALAKIASIKPCRVPQWIEIYSMYTQSSSLGRHMGWSSLEARDSTHTPQQVLEMAGMAKQGHAHAESMALYAEDAKTTDKPWELWELLTNLGTWVGVGRNPDWCADIQYRRKPKTHTVNGVEVPDLRIDPNEGEEYYMPNPVDTYLYLGTTCNAHEAHDHRKNNNLCYEYTEAGKQAAILHAKAWLGIE